MILPGRGMESRSREEWKSPICYSGEGIQPAWGNQAMANVKRETIRITVPFGVLIALLCEEAFRVCCRDFWPGMGVADWHPEKVSRPAVGFRALVLREPSLTVTFSDPAKHAARRIDSDRVPSPVPHFQAQRRGYRIRNSISEEGILAGSFLRLLARRNVPP